MALRWRQNYQFKGKHSLLKVGNQNEARFQEYALQRESSSEAQSAKLTVVELPAPRMVSTSLWPASTTYFSSFNSGGELISWLSQSNRKPRWLDSHLIWNQCNLSIQKTQSKMEFVTWWICFHCLNNQVFKCPFHTGFEFYYQRMRKVLKISESRLDDGNCRNISILPFSGLTHQDLKLLGPDL